MADTSKAFEISNDGLLVSKADGTDGVWFGGGDAAPTHSAVIGSIYLRTDGDWYRQDGPGTTDWAIVPISDELAKISTNDTTPGFLDDKVVVGSGITKTILNPGANETLELSSSIIAGSTLAALFASAANNVNNKFLESESIATSDSLPGVVPVDETLTKLTFSNVNSAPTGTIEIRVNTTVGTPAASVVLTTSTRTEVFTISLAVLAGDELNCFISSASGVGKPLVKLYA